MTFLSSCVPMSKFGAKVKLRCNDGTNQNEENIFPKPFCYFYANLIAVPSSTFSAKKFASFEQIADFSAIWHNACLYRTPLPSSNLMPELG